MEEIVVTLDDPKKPDNQKFANMVDPVLLSIFVERAMSTEETRTLDELFTDLLEGEL